MKTKFIALALISIITIVNCYGQAFEGKVVYALSYKSKMPNLTDQQFSSMMGTTQEYFIKGGNYKSSSNGTMLQWQIFINKDNKLYSKMSNSPAVFWNDVTVNADEIVKTEVNENVVEVLGYKCDELVLTCKSGIQKYYFNTKLRVDPKLFENHKFGNWSVVVSKSNSLPLKMIIDNPQFSFECVATDVKPMSLNDNLFELPAGSTLEKSPY